MFSSIFVILSTVSCFSLAHGTDQAKILRMVSWNVADNSRMSNGFNNGELDKLLGIRGAGQKTADIYAVGLQEQCWNCNFKDMMEIPKAFLRRLKSHGDFEIVGIEGTRESSMCKMGCSLFGNHGTTALFVIAKKGLIGSHEAFHRNDGCSDNFPENDEKGVAYMRLALSTGQSVCVASSHLESKSPKTRRQCLKNFLSDAEKNLNWSSECDFHFISGDFNARTAAAALAGQNNYFPPETDFASLKQTDELLGGNPYGRDASWKGNLLSFINSVQNKIFKETEIGFAPTYKLDHDIASCKGKVPCYRTDRPLSWTDRIIHTRGKSLQYDSIHLLNSDHLPVFEEFELS